MADPLVISSDLELYLTGWYRSALAARPEQYCQGVVVTNREPGPNDTWPKRLLVIRDDGGAVTGTITAEHSVGLSVLAGTKEAPQEAKDLARMVHALRSQIPSIEVSNPVSAVLSAFGPYAVAEAQPAARQYLTITVAVVGTPL